MSMTRRSSPGSIVLLLLLRAVAALGQPGTSPPNFVVLLADDLGYGDLSGYGHPTIATPRLDRLADEGIRLTSFYTSPICTPTRIELLTGRHAMRSGLYRVLYPPDQGGIPSSELTVAESLEERGYRTALIGKWHLGHSDVAYFPTQHGFDEYFGLIYSNDLTPPWNEAAPALRFYRGNQPLDGPVDQGTLTQRYTEEAVRFLRTNRQRPFFLYLAHSMPHFPVHASEAFRGTSPRGPYGDAVQEIDWSVGRILDTLHELGLDERTLVVFTSDNGPATTLGLQGGSPGPFAGGKGTSYEGGFRVPFIARWPGRIPAGRTSAEMATMMDLFPTFLKLAGAELPADRPIDGKDITPLLRGEGVSPHEAYHYLLGPLLEGVRVGPWKLRQGPEFPRFIRDLPRLVERTRTEGRAFAAAAFFDDLEVELYNVETDPGERLNVAGEHPEIVADLRRRMEAFGMDLKPGPAFLGWPVPGLRVPSLEAPEPR
jgi:arylsulfatase A-like enzyme